MDLSTLDLSGIQWDCTSLRKANLSGCNLSQTSFVMADLRGANLCRANLSHTNLRGAQLDHANLSDANLREANLRDAKLSMADLTGSNLTGADLSISNLFLHPVIVETELMRAFFLRKEQYVNMNDFNRAKVNKAKQLLRGDWNASIGVNLLREIVANNPTHPALESIQLVITPQDLTESDVVTLVGHLRHLGHSTIISIENSPIPKELESLQTRAAIQLIQSAPSKPLPDIFQKLIENPDCSITPSPVLDALLRLLVQKNEVSPE